ncbi:MAG: hypothetical protein A3I61_16415 [Acidobacteria bacterium RIFCSPLOWO2_02_FULL_68_18]|nr:MAG: hypothetical protein A3I61_16415 [Acidobacteria bacterium RIFCSPLOWO2_02_FULL_68_18]OFW48591.1 MAG: hypothetical protein A3G77_13855 [Acidobacteria bacterium RIFCSPLOWO2_12_FULL_68_19]
MVVDDGPGIPAFVECFAQGEGFDVIAHAGGYKLLTALRALKPDVVLLDRDLPEVGGLDILRAIRDADPTCHVILMTADPRSIRPSRP